MNEWKWIGIASLIVNVMMVGILVVAVFIVKGIVDDKDNAITKLENEMATLKETPVVVKEEVEAVEEEPEVVEDIIEEQPKVEKPITQQSTPQKAPATQQTDYKQKLMSYHNSLADEFEIIYFLFDGMPPEDILSNAEVKDMYESAYKSADSALNEVYRVLKETLPQDQFSVLQNEQRAWLSDLNKSKEDRLAMGGSSASSDALLDMAIKTQERTLDWLYKYFGFKPVH